MGMIPAATTGFIRTIMDCEKIYDESIIDKEFIRKVIKDARRIGSVMLVDTMKEDEIYQILMEKTSRRLTSA